MVRRYKTEDFDQIKQWLIDRNQKVFHPRILPKVGFIVDDLAAVFLYQTDSDLAYIENLVSNPHAGYEERDDAICQVTDTALQAATILGFKFVMGVTKNKSVLVRAVKKGAKVEAGQFLLTKQLK